MRRQFSAVGLLLLRLLAAFGLRAGFAHAFARMKQNPRRKKNRGSRKISSSAKPSGSIAFLRTRNGWCG